MKPLSSEATSTPAYDPQQLLLGRSRGDTLNLAIAGGGRLCYAFLKLLDPGRLSRLKIRILGVSDPNPEAPGLLVAKERNLFTTPSLSELLSLEKLHGVINLTGSDSLLQALRAKNALSIHVMDPLAGRLFLELIQADMDRVRLGAEKDRTLTSSRRHTQEILDSLPYRVMVVNLDMTIEMVNEAFVREFHIDQDHVLGRPCYEVRYGLEKPCKEYGQLCFMLDQMEEIPQKGFYHTVREYKDRKGETHIDSISLAPIFDEVGEMVQILEVSRDMTERIKLEREVLSAKTFFENVIQSTVDGIVVVDTKGRVLIFNEGMARLTGFPAVEIIEHGHLSSFYNMDVARENMRKMRSGQYGPVGKLNPTPMTVTTKDGQEIPVTLTASLITIDGKEVGSVGVFTDMREVLQMRRELEEAHLQLVRSERIASVGRMAAGVAHEINNPLSGILIYAELLKERFGEMDAQVRDDFQEIIDQTLRCKKIVSDLLEFSRQSVGKASSFRLEDMINKCLGLLINQSMFQDVQVVKHIQPEMPSMVGDMGQIQQVFTNLFINAVDAMQGKGRLGIEATYDQAGSQFVIRVSDTGPGIPPHVGDKIFDIFFTTKPVGKGTGLGLSISQRIVALHGGSLSYECPAEGGTVFVVELPLESADTSEEQPLFIGLDG